MSLGAFRMAYRAYRNVASYGSTANEPSLKRSPQAVIGAAGLATVVLACAWTLYANIAGPGVTPVAVDLPQTAYIPGASAALRTTVAKLEVDVTSSLGVVSSTFNERFLTRLDDAKPALAKADRLPISRPRQQQAEAQVPAPAPVAEEPQAPATYTVASLPLPEVRPTVLTVPLPTPRPSILAAKADQGPSRNEIAQANKAAALAAIAIPKPTIFERLFGKFEKGPMLAFASPDGGISSDGQSLTPGQTTGLYDRQTAVYDISAKMVYLPNGTKLEAHSGLGSKLDDPRYVHVRMNGATPPHTYDLSMRESLFHGVQALRLNPVGGEGNVFGRTGLLAHTYMLGPNGDSNGCVSFKDYDAFLRAYKNNEIKRLVVVASLK